jgi:hypothetical protein
LIHRQQNLIFSLPSINHPSTVYAFEYGPPKYGLSGASWALLIQSRKAVEEIVQMLGIKVGLLLQYICS